jgi:hypothetical protein
MYGHQSDVFKQQNYQWHHCGYWVVVQKSAFEETPDHLPES